MKHTSISTESLTVLWNFIRDEVPFLEYKDEFLARTMCIAVSNLSHALSIRASFFVFKDFDGLYRIRSIIID